MITKNVLKKFATDCQTSEFPNIVREYFQHLFLSQLARQKEGQNLLFKGGTALRIIYGSPRFSEDLDFSIVGIPEKKQKEFIETCFARILADIEKTGVKVELGRKPDVTKEGYYGEAAFRMYDYPPATVALNISTRPHDGRRAEVDLIANEFVPTYHLYHLPQAELVSEKIFGALLERKKARDFYDLYFIMRRGLLSSEQKKRLKEEEKNIVAAASSIYFKTELGVFLPRDQQAVIRDFEATLARELHSSLG